MCWSDSARDVCPAIQQGNSKLTSGFDWLYQGTLPLCATVQCTLGHWASHTNPTCLTDGLRNQISKQISSLLQSATTRKTTIKQACVAVGGSIMDSGSVPSRNATATTLICSEDVPIVLVLKCLWAMISTYFRAHLYCDWRSICNYWGKTSMYNPVP